MPDTLAEVMLPPMSDLLALGGAVYTSSDMTFSAGGKVRTISGNYTEDTKRGKNYNGLFVYKLSSSLPTITFDTAGGGINTGFTASCFFGTLLIVFAEIKDFYEFTRCRQHTTST